MQTFTPARKGNLAQNAINEMSRGKHLSLDEARRMERLGQFAKETQYQEGDGDQFDCVLGAMTGGDKAASASRKKPSKTQTSNAARNED